MGKQWLVPENLTTIVAVYNYTDLTTYVCSCTDMDVALILENKYVAALTTNACALMTEPSTLNFTFYCAFSSIIQIWSDFNKAFLR